MMRRWVLGAVVALLASCGGGGGSQPAANDGKVDPKTELARLTVSAGSGGGAVTSVGTGGAVGGGIDCGSDCSEDLVPGKSIELRAIAAQGFEFKGWSEPCAAANAAGCAVTVNGNLTITATFQPLPPVKRKLDLSVMPAGGGSVTSVDGGLDCAPRCSQDVVDKASIELIAAAKTGYRFVGWSGGCSGTIPSCALSMSVDTVVTAQFEPIVLTLTKTGAGSVTSVPSGIQCGALCAALFAAGDSVTLMALPDPGQVFTGWTGLGIACGAATNCSVPMSGSRTVAATFTPAPRYALTTTVSGSGVISSAPAGIQCGAQCLATFVDGTTVTLSATPATGQQFRGWSGACTGQGTCAVTMRTATAVGAIFEPIPPNVYALTVNATTGGGVTATAAGINCGSVCASTVTDGTQVVLTATPLANYRFGSWGSACASAGSATTCTTTVTANATVSANFTPIMQTLTVSRSGQGSVASSPAGISCGATCSVALMQGTQVTLSASPAAGYQFSGWTGACTGTVACNVTLDTAKSVGATFTQIFHTVTVTRTGGGTVSGSTGIDCGATCAASFAQGSNLTLVATPDLSLSFGGWSGACASAASNTCVLTVTGPLSVGAVFQDVTPPEVQGVSPANNGTNVSVNTPVVVTFSEPINCTSFGAAFSLLQAGASVTGSTTCSGTSATFTPSAALLAGENYTAQIAVGVRDAAGNATTQSQSATFRTAPPPSQGFTFLAYGDSRAGGAAPAGCQGNVRHAQLVGRMAAESAAMVFHLGDMVTGYDDTTNWVQAGPTCPSNGSFKDLIQPLTSKAYAPGLPAYFFPVIGNHDDNWGGGWYPDKLGDGFCGVFKAFENIVPNHTQQAYFQDSSSAGKLTDVEFKRRLCLTTDQSVYSKFMYYSFNYSNTHFVVMRLNNDGDNLMACSGSNCGTANESNYSAFYNKHQLDWLRADLASAANNAGIENIVVFLHAPMFTDSDGHAANASSALLAKEFSLNPKVKMVFSGHNHGYERTVPINASSGTAVQDNASGISYVVTGGGGSDLNGFLNQNTLIAVKQAKHHYVRIEVNGPAIKATAIDNLGATIDTFQR